MLIFSMSRSRSFKSLFSRVSTSSVEALLLIGWPRSTESPSIPYVVDSFIRCDEIKVLLAFIKTARRCFGWRSFLPEA